MGFDKLRYIALLLLQQPNIVDSQNFSFPQGYATEPAALPGNPSPLGLALVKVAGGDRALLNAFRILPGGELPLRSRRTGDGSLVGGTTHAAGLAGC